MREQTLRSQEMFIPLVHPPGHAQADFGEAVVVIGGIEQKAHFFAFDLPHSDACFVKAYPAETTEAFCDGHNSAFAFFGSVPQSILYDNTKIAVARILGDGKRVRSRIFSPMGNPPALPGDLKSLTYAGVEESLSIREQLKVSDGEAFDEVCIKSMPYDVGLQVSHRVDTEVSSESAIW